MKKTIQDFEKMKRNREKISMVTAYDYPTAKLLEKAGVDMLLVGDSLGMVVLGYENTVAVTVDEVLHHLKAARRGAKEAFILADLPFMSYATPESALTNAGLFLKEGGADAVKLEGGEHQAIVVETLVKAGIPVMGHIGLTPQTATQLGGFKVQGKNIEGIEKLIKDAKALEEAGAFAILLEAIPKQVAKILSESTNIPTIGIGAGPDCDGQVLVFHDMFGLFDQFKPKFVKEYVKLSELINEGLINFIKDVKDGVFPGIEQSYTIADDVINSLYGGQLQLDGECFE